MWSAGGRLPEERCQVVVAVFLLVTALIVVDSSAQQSPSVTLPPPAKSSTLPETSNAAPSVTTTASRPDTSALKLGPGDLLELSVYGVPELNTKARVSGTGDIYLPLVDYVHVGGLPLEAAQRLIEKRLSDGSFVKSPHVALFINEYTSQGVTLLGEVIRPGIYPATGERRLFDVISAAGGFTDKAGKFVTITHRDKAVAPVKVHLPRQLESSTADNIDIVPGDTILVSRAGIVYVVGDVGRPSGFVMDSDSITVLQAIAMAGGTNRTAKLNSARIIRKTPAGMHEEEIPLKKILQAKMQDLPMSADDILFVPSSAGKSAAYRGVDAILQTATALTIVAAHP
jgi:polysaccharide biosynthesis/export protein